MSRAQREAAGRRALLSFGAGMASVGPFDTLGQGMAAGVRNAQASQYGAEGLQAERQLGAQTWQQQQFANRLEALKSALPMLKLQIGAGLPNMLGTGNAGVVAGKTPGGQISPNSYEGSIAGTEGTGANPRSSATGTGQFIDSTWQAFAQANPDLFKGMTPAQVMAARSDPAIGAKAITWLAQQNAAALTKQGVAPTGQSLGIAHYLGADGAAGVMNAADTDKVSSFVGDAAIKANPELADMTVGQLKKRYAATPDPTFLKPPPAQGTQFAGPGVPVGNLGLVRNPDGTVGTPGGGFRPAPGAPAAAPAAAPADGTAPAAQAQPQAPQQPGPEVADADLTYEQFKQRHGPGEPPDYLTVQVDPAAKAARDAALADVAAAKRQAAQITTQANRGLPGDVDKANTEFINATQRATEAEQNYNKLVQDAQQKTIDNKRAWQQDQDTIQQKNYAAARAEKAATGLETQRGQQAIQLEQARTQQLSRQKLIDQADSDAKDARESVDQLEALHDISRAAGGPNITAISQGMRDWLGRLNVLTPDQMTRSAAQTTLEAANNRLISALRKGTGFQRTTNMDLQFLQRSGPGGPWTPEEYRDSTTGFLLDAYRHQQKYSALMHDYMSDGMSYSDAMTKADKETGPILQQVPTEYKGAPLLGQAKDRYIWDNYDSGAFYKDQNGNLARAPDHSKYRRP
jgi:hypothetical protein